MAGRSRSLAQEEFDARFGKPDSEQRRRNRARVYDMSPKHRHRYERGMREIASIERRRRETAARCPATAGPIRALGCRTPRQQRKRQPNQSHAPPSAGSDDPDPAPSDPPARSRRPSPRAA